MPTSRPAVFTNKNATYDDKFEDVMAYANAKISQLGKLKTIRNEEDLRAVLQELNNLEAKKGKEPRMSQEFVEKIVASNSAKKSKGLKLGSVKPSAFRAALRGYLEGRRASLPGGSREEQGTIGAGGVSDETLRRLRANGKEIYTYDGGLAVKEVRGSTVYFRDAKTGRFVSKRVRFDEA